jgi:hypothetical protein
MCSRAERRVAAAMDTNPALLFEPCFDLCWISRALSGKECRHAKRSRLQLQLIAKN